MRNAKLSLLILILVTVGAARLQAQISLDVNNAQQFVTEVFADCPEYQNQEQYDRGAEILSRIRIHEVNLSEYPECKKLSECDLRDKCNTSLTYDLSDFSVQTFNPLIYRLKFYSDQSEYYRIDGKNYIIEILPTATH